MLNKKGGIFVRIGRMTRELEVLVAQMKDQPLIISGIVDWRTL